MLPLTAVQAGLYGRVDVGMQLDNRVNDPSAELTTLADIVFDDVKEGFRSGITLALRQRDERDEQQLQQLFFEKRVEAVSISLGRLERSDGLGFYTLDGGAFKIRRNDALIELYAGRPGRIEGYSSVSAQWLSGARMLFSHRVNWPLIERIQTRLGLQDYQDNQGDSVTRISFGLTTDGKTGEPLHDRLQLLLQGNYLPSDGHFERLHARAITVLSEEADMSWSYQSFQPDESQPTLQGRFYASYARARQRVVQVEYNYRNPSGIDWLARGRHIHHEQGRSGQGVTFGAGWSQADGVHWQSEADWLVLADDRIGTLYLERRTVLSAECRLVLSGVLQQQVQQQGDDNQTVGFEVQLEQKLASELRLSFSAMQLLNSHKDDEYRLALRLSYRFDDRQRRRWQ